MSPRWSLSRVRRELHPAVGNFGWLSFDRVYRLTFSLIVGTWVARYLGPTSYGVMSYGVAIVVIVSLLPSLGLDGLMRRDLVRHPDDHGKLLGTLFLLRLGAGLLTFGGLTAAVWWLEPDPTLRLAILMPGVVILSQATLTIDLWFQSQLLSKHSVIAQNVAFTLLSLLRVASVLLGAPFEWFLVMLAFDGPLTALLLVRAYRREHQGFSTWTWDSGVARTLLVQSWPLALSSIALMTYLKVDQVLVQRLAGETENGFYAAAIRLTETVYMLPMMLAASLAPLLVQARARDRAEYEQRVRQLFLLATSSAWLATVFLVLFAPWIVWFLFGPAFAPSTPMLSVLAFALPFIALGVARQEYLLNEGLLGFQMTTSFLGVAINILLNLWWIPMWGGLGAAATAVVTSLSVAVMSSLGWGRTRRMGLWQLEALLMPWRVLTIRRSGRHR